MATQINEVLIAKQKKLCRSTLLHIRESLSHIRRQEASRLAYQFFLSFSQKNSLILSYASFASELDIWKINQLWAKEGRLVLPRIEGRNLRVYHVSDIGHLITNQWGILEPNPMFDKEISLPMLDLILVPGLGFDTSNGHRLGYGKGYYDNLLSQLSTLTHCFGIGFKEQAYLGLPFSIDDVALSNHYLF